MDLTAAIREHERLFNASVLAGDFTAFVATFADEAVMSFDHVPAGPYRGREAIARAYATRPPTGTMTIRSIKETGPDSALVQFDWDAGGGGSMRVRWQAGQVAELTIAFRS